MGRPLRRRRRAQLPRAQARSCARPCSTRSPTCARATTSSSARARAARPRSTCARGDLANMGLARAADLPGAARRRHRPRRRLRARCYGTLALLEPDDQALVAGFVINKFRGDAALLAPGPRAAARALTGRPTLGVLPWLRRAVARRRGLAGARGAAARGGRPRAVATRSRSPSSGCRWMSNFTDVDALAGEPGVQRALHALAGRRRAAPTSSSLPGHQGDGRGPRAAARRRARRRGRSPRAARATRCSASAAATRCSARRSRTTSRVAAARWPVSGCCRSARASARQAAAPRVRHGRAGRRRTGHAATRSATASRRATAASR